VEDIGSLDCLLTITHAEPDFDNASPYLFFREKQGFRLEHFIHWLIKDLKF
jgi:hypothetical protein